MEIKESRDSMQAVNNVTVSYTDLSLHQYGAGVVFNAALRQVADYIAKRFIELHAQEILAQMNVQAVANLAIADAAAAIRKTLDSGITGLRRTLIKP